MLRGEVRAAMSMKQLTNRGAASFVRRTFQWRSMTIAGARRNSRREPSGTVRPGCRSAPEMWTWHPRCSGSCQRHPVASAVTVWTFRGGFEIVNGKGLHRSTSAVGDEIATGCIRQPWFVVETIRTARGDGNYMRCNEARCRPPRGTACSLARPRTASQYEMQGFLCQNAAALISR